MAQHIIPPKTYYKVFAALMVLLFLTVLAAEIEHNAWNTVIAMTIAATKALLIILIFMHVKYSSRLTQVLAFVGFVWLLLLLVLLAGDYGTRRWPLETGHKTDVSSNVTRRSAP
jgi:cytochrome c oxidase subunit 4